MQRTINTYLQLSYESISRNIEQMGKWQKFPHEYNEIWSNKMVSEKKTKTKIIIFIKINDFPLYYFYLSLLLSTINQCHANNKRKRLLLEKQINEEEDRMNQYCSKNAFNDEHFYAVHLSIVTNI